jgi:hypothetical protein
MGDLRQAGVFARGVLGCAAAAVAVGLAAHAAPGQDSADRGWWAPGAGGTMPAEPAFPNPAGKAAILNTSGPVDTKGHPFFEALGTNGRACVTCHQPSDGMSLSVESVQARWTATGGRDPLFAAVDGSNCPSLPQDRAASHSLLLEKGLFRIALPWPPKSPDGKAVRPEFTLEVVKDPTACNLDPVYGLKSGAPHVSVYRRPRMTANLKYVTSPFSLSGRFDGKRGVPLAINPATGQRVGLPIMSDARAATLTDQAVDALFKHEQVGQAPDAAQLRRIVDYESQVFAAQSAHPLGGDLMAADAPPALGPRALAKGPAIVAGFNWNNPVFLSFDTWRNPRTGDSREQAEFRASVARGYDIFFQRPFWIRDVAWFNSIGMGNPYKRTCAICHSVHMTGNDISPGVMDIGVNNLPTADPRPDLPLFKITCRKEVEPHYYLGRTIYTHDPGRALISGKCVDVGSLVMQQMRSLSARAPYFSNGSAKDLRAVVDFYDRRFEMQMTEQDKVDLTNFLAVL